MFQIKSPEEYGYVLKNNICLFQKGPLSQWWGGFKGQDSTFKCSSALIAAHRDSEAGHYLDVSFEPLTFNCCEQWMMANKATFFDDLESFHKIMATTNPSEQKTLGRAIRNYNEKKWENVRYDIVLRGNKIKFEQNPDLKEFLQQFSKHTIFAEAAPWDKIWGIGLGPEDSKSLDIYKWQGLNLLGEVIREVRQKR